MSLKTGPHFIKQFVKTKEQTVRALEALGQALNCNKETQNSVKLTPNYRTAWHPPHLGQGILEADVRLVQALVDAGLVEQVAEVLRHHRLELLQLLALQPRSGGRRRGMRGGERARHHDVATARRRRRQRGWAAEVATRGALVGRRNLARAGTAAAARHR